jgi:phenylalanyl-tRNA synthetase beta chain
LHAFDANKLGGSQIVVRRAADGEKITTLDGKERVLNSRMLVIADAAKPVVIAGIMGGENSGVGDDTTDLVLEVRLFQAPVDPLDLAAARPLLRFLLPLRTRR